MLSRNFNGGSVTDWGRKTLWYKNPLFIDSGCDWKWQKVLSGRPTETTPCHGLEIRLDSIQPFKLQWKRQGGTKPNSSKYGAELSAWNWRVGLINCCHWWELFSDVFKFTLFPSDGRKMVFRRKNERYTDACVVEQDKKAGGVHNSAISHGLKFECVLDILAPQILHVRQFRQVIHKERCNVKCLQSTKTTATTKTKNRQRKF